MQNMNVDEAIKYLENEMFLWNKLMVIKLINEIKKLRKTCDELYEVIGDYQNAKCLWDNKL